MSVVDGAPERSLPLTARLRAHPDDPVPSALVQDVEAWCATLCWSGLARHVFASAELTEVAGELVHELLLHLSSTPRRPEEVRDWRPLLLRIRAAAGDKRRSHRLLRRDPALAGARGVRTVGGDGSLLGGALVMPDGVPSRIPCSGTERPR